MNQTVINHLQLVNLSRNITNDKEVNDALKLIEINQSVGLVQLADTLYGRYEVGMRVEQAKLCWLFVT